MGAGGEVTGGRVQYARNGSVRLAYRVFGDADTALVGVPGWVSNVDFYDDPMSPLTGFKNRLAASTRYVVWDKRGTGLSDPVTEPPPLDERMDDLRAVMDAAGVEEAALWGGSEGGPLSLLFAATYPERVRSLVLYGAAARFSCDPPGYPWGWTPVEVDAQLREIDDHWADGAMVELFLGSVADVEGVRELFGRGSRACASPTMAKLLWQALNEIDVRDILDSVTAPTLVLHRPGDRVVALEAGRDLAARLPNATFRELPPGDHVGLDILDLLASEILAFVVGNETAAGSGDRVLATVLFTDIADSTEALNRRRATNVGAASLMYTTRSSNATSRHSPVRRSNTPATECSRSSTDLRRQLVAHSNSCRCWHPTEYASELESTPVNANVAAMTGVALPYMSAPASARWQSRARYSRREPSVTSPQARA